MEQFYNSEYTCSVDAPKVAEQAKYAKALAVRLTKDNYFQEALDKHHYDKTFSEPIFSVSDKPDKDGYYKGVWTKNQEQLDLFRKCSKEGDKMREKDKHEFWTYIERHINEWWD